MFSTKKKLNVLKTWISQRFEPIHKYFSSNPRTCKNTVKMELVFWICDDTRVDSTLIYQCLHSQDLFISDKCYNCLVKLGVGVP